MKTENVVAIFHVIDSFNGRRMLASAEDKAALDRYVADKGLEPIPVEIVWSAEAVLSLRELSLSKLVAA
jgi:hypothetical protein